MRTSLRAFTLIELLVVIAIIGVLSAVVLSALDTARNKGNDAAVKSNIDQARAQAELFYDSNGNHYVVTPAGTTDMCSATGAIGTVKGIYPSVLAAAQATGLNAVNNTIATAGSNITSTCHTCFANEAGTSCASAPVQDRWAAEAPLKSVSGTTFCIDSTGFAGTTTSFLGGGDAICN